MFAFRYAVIISVTGSMRDAMGNSSSALGGTTKIVDPVVDSAKEAQIP